MKPTDSIRIYRWMIDGLQLKGAELMVYAYIFSKVNDQYSLSISLRKIESFFEISKSQLIRSLKVLNKFRYLNVKLHTGKKSEYSLNLEAIAYALKKTFDPKASEREIFAEFREKKNPSPIDKFIEETLADLVCIRDHGMTRKELRDLLAKSEWI